MEWVWAYLDDDVDRGMSHTVLFGQDPAKAGIWFFYTFRLKKREGVGNIDIRVDEATNWLSTERKLYLHQRWLDKKEGNMARKCKSWCELGDKQHRGPCKKQCKSTQPSPISSGEVRCQLEKGHDGQCSYSYVSYVHTCDSECVDIHP